MGMFKFLKKKKKEELLPLPPAPTTKPIADIVKEIPSIKPELPAPELKPSAEEPIKEEESQPAPEKITQPEPQPETKPEEITHEIIETPSIEPEAELPEKKTNEMPVFEPTVKPIATLPIKAKMSKRMFVSVDDYRAVLENANIVRARLLEAEDLVKHIGEIKQAESKQFERWRAHLEDIEKKLTYVDNLISQAQR